MLRVVWAALLVVTGNVAVYAAGPDCVCRGDAGPGSETHETTTREWRYPIGAIIRGSGAIDIAGDGRPERFTIVSEVQRDRAFNPVTKSHSAELFCWFNTRMAILGQEGDVIYKDHYSIKFDDMPALLETHGAQSPEDYFSRFSSLRGYFETGVEVSAASEADIRPDAVEWSLKAQGIKGAHAGRIVEELSRLKELRLFTDRAEWREDLRVIAYVPSLHRGVAIQVGY